MCIRDSYPEDRSRLEEIKSIDPAAVILNGYYCGHLGEDMSLDELTAGVPVSYTHLDVYKRQLSILSAQNTGIC